MRDLATYSIETDHSVLLTFTDGRRQRVPIAQLEYHLTPTDLAVVQGALLLRKSFLKSHMPKVALALAAGGMLATLAVVGKPVAAGLFNPQDPGSPTDSSAVVRSVTPADATSTPAPSVGITPPAKVASPKPQVAKTASTAKPSAGTTQASVQTTPAPLPSSPANEPTVTPAPSPSASPEPTPVPGQVLGDSTAVSASPAPEPTPAAE